MSTFSDIENLSLDGEQFFSPSAPRGWRTSYRLEVEYNFGTDGEGSFASPAVDTIEEAWQWVGETVVAVRERYDDVVLTRVGVIKTEPWTVISIEDELSVQGVSEINKQVRA